jgi:hypothetical protein
MLTLQDIQKKYGANLTWENGQASGTCLCTSHSKVAVEAIKNGIASGRGRAHVFGPVAMGLAGQVVKTAAEIRVFAPIAKKGGVGRYFTGKFSGPLSHSWEEALPDALFRCLLVRWDGYSTDTTILDGLKFPTLESFVEFMNNFITDGKYDFTFLLSCYFLEDQSIPKIGQVGAMNGFYGALTDNGGGIVDFTALRNPSEPLLLDTFLRAVFLEHHGIALPPAMSFEDVASLFWAPRQRNKKSMYNQQLTGTMATNIGERQMWDSINNVLVPIEENQGEVGSGIRNWSLNWEDKTIAKVDGPMRTLLSVNSKTEKITSAIMSVPVVDKASGDLKAIHFAPYGIDNLSIGRELDLTYGVHFVTGVNVGEASAFRVVDLDPMNPSQSSSKRFYKRDWTARTNYHDGQGDSVGDIRARLYRKGTPFVGALSDWAIKNMRKLGMRFVGSIVE